MPEQLDLCVKGLALRVRGLPLKSLSPMSPRLRNVMMVIHDVTSDPTLPRATNTECAECGYNEAVR